MGLLIALSSDVTVGDTWESAPGPALSLTPDNLCSLGLRFVLVFDKA